MPPPCWGPHPGASVELVHLGVRGFNPPFVRGHGLVLQTMACIEPTQTSCFPGRVGVGSVVKMSHQTPGALSWLEALGKACVISGSDVRPERVKTGSWLGVV